MWFSARLKRQESCINGAVQLVSPPPLGPLLTFQLLLAHLKKKTFKSLLVLYSFQYS
jgi:hypothetical protein